MGEIFSNPLDLLWPALALLSLALLLLLWCFRRRWQGVLPPREEVPVPWSGMELLAALFLGFYLIPIELQALLNLVGFFPWLYGPPPAAYLAAFAAAPDAAFPAGVPWGPLVLSVERGPVEVARRAMWVNLLAFPLQMLLVPLFLRIVSGTRLRELGLDRRFLGRNLLAGLLGWLLITPLAYTIQQVAQHFLQGPPETHALTKVAQHPEVPIEGPVIALVAVIVAPLWEELLFRGVLPRWLARQAWGGAAAVAACWLLALLHGADDIAAGWRSGYLVGAVRAAAPLLFVMAMTAGFVLLHWTWRSPAADAVYGTALFFAIGHSAWPQPLALFVLGLGLGWLAQRTQSLAGPMLMHALFNAVACLWLLVS
jgi:membrane protease YdiL (CAAX protease family)